jgi:crossover junction endodeoxyribonuclease RuvC
VEISLILWMCYPVKLLGLDIATRTGWCAGEPGGVPEFGAIRLIGRDEPEGAAFSKFREWLEGAVETWGITHVFTEESYVPRPSVQFRRSGLDVAAKKKPPVDMAAINRLIGLRAIARMVAYEAALPYEGFTPARIAKHFTGFARFDGGRTEKKRRVIDIAKLYGYEVGSDDDMADAIAVWHLGCATVAPYARPAGPLLARTTPSMSS